jgi:BMFP domain-containing protein YqiC
MAKYQQYFEMMLSQNKKAFDDFKIVHDNFAKDPKTFRNEFNQQGREIQDLIRIYENKLCGHSESSGYSKFSANLAEKFHQEIKKHFPKIDLIGME